MIKLSDVKSLQLEITNLCNAACPQCPRNFFGGKTLTTLPLKNWTLTEFRENIPLEQFTSLEQVYFCGTYGDPFSNYYITQIVQHIKSILPEVKIGIHTNGGIGKNKTYVEVAPYVDFIAFGIDGLEDTNHIYRRNVLWDKVMDNATTFIAGGGIAYWDYIVFDHNQDQVDAAEILSKEMGFAKFSAKRTGRFLNRKHEYESKLTVYNKKNLVDYIIYPPSDPKYRNSNYDKLPTSSISEYAKKACISCNALNIKEIYIGADGFVFPCGWLHDRLYGPEVDGTADQTLMKSLMHTSGGLASTNVFHGKLKNIVEGEWFANIQKSWTDGNRLERCGVMCGDQFNLIGEQNLEVGYKE
jgi:MoaA/NifB/PqqE/SkfB family radical SAM enzyme|tara:strand:- start:1895 stop:2962 length:1068 start_codon:yes stop_codon:yes gene_type:complete